MNSRSIPACLPVPEKCREKCGLAWLTAGKRVLPQAVLGIVALLAAAPALTAQCYTFSDGNGTTISISIPSLPKPVTGTDSAGDKTFRYDVTGPGKDVVSVTVNGSTITTDDVPILQIEIISGPALNYFTLAFTYEEASTSTFEYMGGGILLEAPGDPSVPNGLLPDGLPSESSFPPLSAWTAGNQISAEVVKDGVEQATPEDDVVASMKGTCPVSQQSCAITSETLAPDPPGTVASRTTLGVGEFVQLKLKGSADSSVEPTWTLDSGQGCLTKDKPEYEKPEQCENSVDGSTVYFTAPYLDGAGETESETGIKAKISGGPSCSLSFTTKRPADLYYQRDEAEGYLYATARLIGMWSFVFTAPVDVSFANIGIEELDHSPPHIAHFVSPPVIATIGGKKAMLLNCDLDYEPVTTEKEIPFVTNYTWGSDDAGEAKSTPFSMDEMSLSGSVLSGHDFTKEQLKDLTANGWEDTPGAPKALVAFTSNATHPMPMSLDTRQCVCDLEKQFTVETSYKPAPPCAKDTPAGR
jgi:hypothetical protein